MASPQINLVKIDLVYNANVSTPTSPAAGRIYPSAQSDSAIVLLKGLIGSIGNNKSPKGRIKKFIKSWLSPFILVPQTIPEALPAAFGTNEIGFGGVPTGPEG